VAVKKQVVTLLRRTVYAIAASLTAWVTCTLPLDAGHRGVLSVCVVFIWPVRLIVRAAAAMGMATDALAVGWCEFCSADVRLYKMLLTAVPTYLVVFYIPAFLKYLVLFLRRRRARVPGKTVVTAK
jgi:hypothetical protein